MNSKSVLQRVLEELINDGDLEGCQIRSYSGRAMYGRECVGLDVDREALINPVRLGVMMAANVVNAHEFDEDQGIAMTEDLEHLEAESAGMNSDSMGLGQI